MIVLNAVFENILKGVVTSLFTSNYPQLKKGDTLAIRTWGDQIDVIVSDSYNTWVSNLTEDNAKRGGYMSSYELKRDLKERQNLMSDDFVTVIEFKYANNIKDS